MPNAALAQNAIGALIRFPPSERAHPPTPSLSIGALAQRPFPMLKATRQSLEQHWRIGAE